MLSLGWKSIYYVLASKRSAQRVEAATLAIYVVNDTRILASYKDCVIHLHSIAKASLYTF